MLCNCNYVNRQLHLSGIFRYLGGEKVGNSINLSETLIITLGGMAIVLAVLILYAISLIVKLLNAAGENQSVNNIAENPVQDSPSNNTAVQSPVQTFNESDDEDRLVAALAASALSAKNRPDSHFRITKITRIK
jgi:Na+-transporting methylmalonyl-CoA/oxaloacetate decarboxylase gamma subunit